MWLKDPPPLDTRPKIDLIRPKPGTSVEAQLIGEPLRCFVHYIAGRSWPCTGHGCTLCKRKIGRRCYAYYPVASGQNTVAILELTAQAESSLISQMAPFSDVPCGVIRVYRPSGKRNNPCSVKWTEPTNNKDRRCPQLNQETLQKTLMKIWQLPEPDGKLEENEYLTLLNEVIHLKTTTQTT